MLREPLSKKEVIDVIERNGCGKVPLLFHKWWGEGLYEKYGKDLDEIANNFPDDVLSIFYLSPGSHESYTSNPSYRWGYKDYTDSDIHSIGQTRVLLDDWDELDKFLSDFPNPDEPENFSNVYDFVKKNSDKDIYKLGCWWRLLHERLWEIRGMENLMLDYYDNMDGLKAICRRLIDFYKRIVDRYSELGFDGIFTSDDLGHQTGPMMSPKIFEELYLPFYKEFISYVHSKNMHVFLHSCGDNTLLMDYLIESGLDVFHPVQIGCMDAKTTAEKYGDKISFLAGADVQHLLPEGTEQEVREGIHSFMKHFHKPNGGLLLAAGNGILPDTPLENIHAFLETATKGIQIPNN